ncbi:hypothetical protein RSOLAG1IB_08706 [Rhizoctonia solani AG-1 IB]|uniref:Uncharacterized protein n=1 Tax=Thanatephorus cucumeris (strain AG1-IB / isolate 7/3/14) TaxID=1108050 RepID=A0A0B7FR05_THACB|nr:hypothetical protein RSOLAG1IB_08706 [Rhizoctonia solani AG-1 IB]
MKDISGDSRRLYATGLGTLYLKEVGHTNQSATRDYAPRCPYCRYCTPPWTAICVWIRLFACSCGFTLVGHRPSLLQIDRQLHNKLRLRGI